MKEKYCAQKATTKNRVDAAGNQILFKLTFLEWSTWWDATGQIGNRGRKKGQFVMARFDDLGHYEIGNIFCSTQRANVQFASTRPMSEETKQKLRKPKSEETKQKMRKPKSSDHKAKLQKNLDNVRIKKKVVTPDREFESAAAAARYYNVSGGAIWWRCKQITGQFKDWIVK